MTQALVIGGGPAGLMAAQVLAEAGHTVSVTDAMPSFGRKFLMAGKSGLNLTKDEPANAFAQKFRPAAAPLMQALADFGPVEVQAWARGLGQEIFTGSTGRVFPTVMKASPLLRAWLRKLADLGVVLETRHRCVGLTETGGARFETPQGQRCIDAKAVVLAMGGASWRRLGSDGTWPGWVGADCVPFAPANVGVVVEWSPHMQKHFGTPIKATALIAREAVSRGEWVIGGNGIEGGGIYTLSRQLREGAPLSVDLRPDLTLAQVHRALSRPRAKQSISNHLRKTLRLGPAQIALLAEFGRPFPDDLAPLIKNLPIRHCGPAPIDQAISTSGGVAWSALNADLSLIHQPHVHCAGEMLDWEAPTGGYLLTGCLATGKLAGAAIAAKLSGF